MNQDQFFAQLFQMGLSDPNSKVYLPGIILSSSNPSLNPYTVASVDLGNQSFQDFNVAVKLNNLAVSGIPNISVAAANGGNLQLAGLNATFLAQFCKLSPPPPNVGSLLSLITRFTLSSPGAGSVGGTFTMTLNAGAVSGAFTLSGQDFFTVVVKITSLAIAIPASVTVNPKIEFDGGQGGFWAKLFQNFLKEQSTIQMIAQKVNEAVVGQLPQLSAQLTQILQTSLKQQLGG